MAIKQYFLVVLTAAGMLVLPQNSFANDYQAWKQQVLEEMDVESPEFAYHEANQELRDLVARHIRESDVYMQADTYSNDPVLFFIRGYSESYIQYFYLIDLKASGKKYRVDAPENQKLIKNYLAYYRKALELDAAPDAPDHLTRDMLIEMADDVLASPDVKIRALRREQQLLQGGGGSPHENYEWGTYEMLLGAYAEQRDYDNYLKTVNEMMERFPNHPRMNELVEYKRQAEVAIEQRDREASMAETKQANVESKPEPAKESKEVVAESGMNQDTQILIGVVAGAFVTLLIGWYAIRRRKK